MDLARVKEDDQIVLEEKSDEWFAKSDIDNDMIEATAGMLKRPIITLIWTPKNFYPDNLRITNAGSNKGMPVFVLFDGGVFNGIVPLQSSEDPP